jgi:type VI protein secretion system component Hcp
MRKTKIILILAMSALATFAFLAFAGDLEPSAAPGPTMHTIEEVYGAVKVGAGPIMGAEDRWVASLQFSGPNGDGFEGSYTIGPDANVIKLVDIYYDVNVPGTQPIVSLFTVTMNIDKCSPKIWQTAIFGQRIGRATIKYYKTATDMTPYYTVTIESVYIRKMASRTVYKGNGKYAHLDTFSLEWSNGRDDSIKWYWDASHQYEWIKMQ